MVVHVVLGGERPISAGDRKRRRTKQKHKTKIGGGCVARIRERQQFNTYRWSRFWPRRSRRPQHLMQVEKKRQRSYLDLSTEIHSLAGSLRIAVVRIDARLADLSGCRWALCAVACARLVGLVCVHHGSSGICATSARAVVGSTFRRYDQTRQGDHSWRSIFRHSTGRFRSCRPSTRCRCSRRTRP